MLNLSNQTSSLQATSSVRMQKVLTEGKGRLPTIMRLLPIYPFRMFHS